MRAVRLLDTREGRAALGALRRLDRAARLVVVQKLVLALAERGLRQMGARAPDYVGGWLYDVMEAVTARRTQDPTLEVWAAIQATDVPMPLRLPKGGPLPHRVAGHDGRRMGFFSPNDFARAYRALLPGVVAIKRKRYRNSAHQVLTLMEALPGTTRQRAARYCSMKPSAIALDHLARRYKLPVGGDALKKSLALAGDGDRRALQASGRTAVSLFDRIASVLALAGAREPGPGDLEDAPAEGAVKPCP